MATQYETVIELDPDNVKNKYMNFKKFDVAGDYSDHRYSKSKYPWWQPEKNWAKHIQKEWRILERDLPDMICVRVYEGRMDLLRAVIIGAEGTPYHEGLFFFDVCFPTTYPNDPPQVYYHSGGLRINPNLYASGKVCLSLLNTWYGAKNETWSPNVSTMLQVLVSIQGMILNAKPYFNEPGYEVLRGSVHGEQLSLTYSQRTLVYSLKTMVYTMRKPPKHFEDLVIGHFRDRASSVLTTCRNYYMKGLGAKCGVVAVKGTRCSPKKRSEAERYMKTLVGAFKQIGAEDLVDFIAEVENLTLKLGNKNLVQKILSCFGI